MYSVRPEYAEAARAGRSGPDIVALRVLWEQWGVQWTNGTWPLACPQCARRDRLRGALAFHGCLACGTWFRARPSRLPLPSIPITIWVVATYLVLQGASTRQMAVLGVSHKTAVQLARWIRRRTQLAEPQKRILRMPQVYSLLRAAEHRRALEEPDFLRACSLVLYDFH